MTIVHTSKSEAGQIFIPEVNSWLCIGTLILVVAFRDATRLGAAYGIAVTGSMGITTILFHVVARHRWHWVPWKITLLTTALLSVDVAFLYGNLIKIPHGGYIPIAIAFVVFVLMATWKTGRKLLNQALHGGALPHNLFFVVVGWRLLFCVFGFHVIMTYSNDSVLV